MLQGSAWSRHCGVNVRAKLAAAVGRQALAADNVQVTCGPGLGARRWGSI